MTWLRHAYCSYEHVYKVSFENIEYFLSYEVRLTLCDDTDDDTKDITIANLFSLKDRQALNLINNIVFIH